MSAPGHGPGSGDATSPPGRGDTGSPSGRGGTGSPSGRGGAGGASDRGGDPHAGLDVDTPQARLRAYLVRLLGTRRVRVEAEGPEGEIAVIHLPEKAVPALLERERRGRVVERAREEGFRHATLSLEPSEEPGPDRRTGRYA